MTVNSPGLNFFKKPVVIGWLVFFVLIISVAFLSYQRYKLFKEARRSVLTTAALNARDKLKAALDYSATATHTLGFIINRYGSKSDFDTVAKELLASYQYVDALELVEGGTITRVYPFEENAAAIGYNILQDSLVNKEAERAIKEKDLFYAGPIALKQGYVGIVGRLPLFSEGRFWGFSAAIIKLSTLIKAAELDSGSNKDFIFQLSKEDPNTGEERFFLPHAGQWRESDWVSVAVAEGDWKIYARFVNRLTAVALLPFVILGFLFSVSGALFAWYGARQPYRLQRLVEEKTLQLKASEERYFSYFEKASDTIIVTDPNGLITEVNASVCKLLGYPREELIGRNFSDFIESQLATDLVNFNLQQQGKELIKEIRLVKKNGDIVELEISVKKIDGDHNLAIGRDLTGLREAQKQVAISESTLRGAFEHSATGMALVSPDGKWLKVNSTLCNMLGYSKDEMKSLSFKDITHVEDQEGGIQFMNEVTHADANVYRGEKRYITKGGGEIWVNLNVSSVRDTQGQLLYFVTQTEDITEKKKIAELLHVREQQLRLFIEYSPAALAMFDRDMRYLITSKRWLSAYGLETKQVIGMSHYELFPDNPQRWRDIHQQCLQGHTAKSEEDYYIDENGKTIWLRWEVHPWRRYNGDIGGIILFTEIITKLKEAEIKFRNLVEQSLVGVCIVQGEQFAYVNPRFAEIFGYRQQDMTNGFPAEKVMAHGYRHLFNYADTTTADKETIPVHVEATGQRKDGEPIFLEVYGIATSYEGLPAVMYTVLDITERKKAEDKLKESEEKFRNLVEKSLAGVYILQEGRVRYINPAHQKIMGYTLQELQAMDNMESIVHKEDIFIFRLHHQPNGIDGSQKQYGLRAIRKDGTLAYLEITTSEIIYEGKPASIGTMLDITNRVEDEIRIGRAVNEAQEKERMQIGMELHDNVKQIMAAALLIVDFIKANLSDTKLAGEYLDNLKDYTKEAIDELRRLSHQLAPVLNKELSFGDQIENLVATMNADSRFAIKIEVSDNDNQLPMEVRTAFYRILQEQLNNIIKYSNAASVTVQIQLNEKDIFLSIRDDGQGFDPALRSEGIGLENIRRRAFVLGGTAKFISSPGKGCEVQVIIPSRG